MGLLSTVATADDFVVSAPTNQTNGGNTLDGNDSLTVTSTGSITPPAGNDGAYASNNNNVIDNQGSIATTGNGARGMFANGNNNVVSNSGSISTTGSGDANGMRIIGTGNTAINSGSITTTNNSASGITAGGAQATVSNSGAITTYGIGSHGISVNGNNAVIDNSGTIITQSASAIELNGNNGTIDNSGSLASNAFTLRVNGDDNVVSNSGSVTAQGTSSFSVFLEGNRNAFWNSGSISAQGNSAFGVRVDGQDNTVTNDGSIEVSGPNADAISVNTTGNTITNSGRVVSANGKAFNFQNFNNTLNLLAPSFIAGEIDIEGNVPSNAVNIMTGPSHSVLWTFTGTPTGGAPNVSGPVPGFWNAATGQFATFDPGAFAAAADSLGDMTRMLSGVGFGGLSGGGTAIANAEDPRRSQFASLEPAAYLAEAGPMDGSSGSVWVRGFGSELSHQGNNATLTRDVRLWGAAAGTTFALGSATELGVMGGYLNGEVRSSSRFSPSFDSDAEGGFGGLASRFDFGAIYVDLAVTGGVLWHDQDRFVNNNLVPGGIEVARSDFQSWFVSPEVAVAADIQVADEWTLTPRAGIRHSTQWLDGYTEAGATANATVGERTVGILEGNAELAVTWARPGIALGGHAGFLGQVSTGDDSVEVGLIGQTNAIAIDGGEAITGYAGPNVTLDFGTARVELAADVFFGDDLSGYQGTGTFVLTY